MLVLTLHFLSSKNVVLFLLLLLPGGIRVWGWWSPSSAHSFTFFYLPTGVTSKTSFDTGLGKEMNLFWTALGLKHPQEPPLSTSYVGKYGRDKVG